MNDSQELAALRVNANNLSRCLDALRQRIENLERKPRSGASNETAASDGVLSMKNEHAELQNSVNMDDPRTGLKKSDVITETVLNTKAVQALSFDSLPTFPAISNGRILSPGYQSRAVNIDARQLNQIEVDTISRQLVVTRVNALATHDIHPGDTITHVNGKPAINQETISNRSGRVTLTLVPAAIHNAPSVFYRVNADYNSDFDDSRICRWLSIDVKKGDVVQVMSQDDNWFQARKVNDLSRVGYLPATLFKEKVAMLSPYGRRVLVLLGAVGVGRRTLKSMLLRSSPQYFATVVPQTSRQARPGEQEGRDYHFVTKEEMLQKIRGGEMIEWGELDGKLYGTYADDVRSVVRSGRVCVLDCAPQALSYLYNSEFMPFVVHVIPPPLEEFLQLENLRHQRRPVDQLSNVCAESDKIANGPYADQIHLTLMNRNMDVTFKRLTDALELLRYDTQWVPESWMS